MAQVDRKKQYEDVLATPVKSFFVNMLTRDISLIDAILDLLDNSVDGILRTEPASKSNSPYKGFFADITLKKDSFTIHDNCGGIPWSLHEYAFRMGKPKETDSKNIHSIGAYGIGMKRAIFKMGSSCLISTQNGRDGYEVEITPGWIEDQDEWKIPVHASRKTMKEDGTTILVSELHGGVSDKFATEDIFATELEKKIASHYALIIHKGFNVRVNGLSVKPKPIELLLEISAKKAAIRPFIYRSTYDGVDIFLAVGFTHPIQSQEEINEDQDEKKYSSEYAGWTVVCNDRAVLYCDKSELTGWGEAGVPNYHPQFNPISGIVEFHSKDPSKLPTTTSKRGIDTSSKLYLQVKNKMREGLQLFTNYTNKWKVNISDAKEHLRNTRTVSFATIKTEAARDLQFSNAKSFYLGGVQYKPELPLPVRPDTGLRRITFSKQLKEIKTVSKYLFTDPDSAPSEVGAKCFEVMYEEATK